MFVHLAPTFPLAHKFEHIRVRMFENLLPTQNFHTILRLDTIATLMIYPWIFQNLFIFVLYFMQLYMHRYHLQPWILHYHM